jgi:hypothetical protein
VVVRGGAYPEGEAIMFDMKRRKTLLGVVAIAGPMARAKQPEHVRRIGVVKRAAK